MTPLQFILENNMANIPYPLNTHTNICSPRKIDNRRTVNVRFNSSHKTDKSYKQTTYARYLFETRIGRELSSEEEVDHIDGNVLNDSPMNLRILSGLENNLKKYMNREGVYSNGTIVHRFKCPVCGNEFEAYHYLCNDYKDIKCCSRECTNKSRHMKNISRENNIIGSYKRFPKVIKYIREVGPKRFVELAATCTNVPIPIFDGIIDLISEDLDWMKAIYMVYSNQIKIGLNCGEDPKIIERLSNLIDFMDQAYLSFMNDFVYIPNFYFNDYRSNTNPGIRLFNSEFINEYTREKEKLKPGLTPFDCDTNSKYQQLPGSIGLTPYNC